MMNKDRLQIEAVRWMSKSELDVFVTVTLKKMLRDRFGNAHWMNAYEAERTGEIMKDRVLRALRNSGFRDSRAVPFYTFYEVSPGDQRPHFHIATKIPGGMEFNAYEDMFRATVGRLDWVHQEIDVRLITYGRRDMWQEVCSYGLKSGISAFLPSASNVSPIG